MLPGKWQWKGFICPLFAAVWSWLPPSTLSVAREDACYLLCASDRRIPMPVVVTALPLFPRVHHLHPLPACRNMLLSESANGVPAAGSPFSQPLEDPSPTHHTSISYSQQATVQTGERPRAYRGKLHSYLGPSLPFQSPLGFLLLELRGAFPVLEQNVSGAINVNIQVTHRARPILPTFIFVGVLFYERIAKA